MPEIVATPSVVLAAVIGAGPGTGRQNAGTPARVQQVQLVRAMLSRSPGHEIDRSRADVCLVFDDWRAAIRTALSLISQLARLPVELAGIDVQIGLDLANPPGNKAGVERVVQVARSAGRNEIRLGAEVAGLVRTDPPDGRIVCRVDVGRARPGTGLCRLGRAIEEVPNNLGRELGGFVGREHEIEQVARLFEAGRFVTISGPPGTGKSRLAVEIAERLLGRYEDGAFFVPLAPIGDPRLMMSTLAGVIEAPIPPGSSAIDAVTSFMQSRRMLIVLDNFEHITLAAADLADVIDAAPGLQVVVTSRSRLRIASEREFPLAPLDIPREGSPQLGGEQTAAVQLFVLRATTAQPTFRLTADNHAVISDLCQRLDGLPLAIELAAARLKLFTVAAIVERLDHRLGLLGGGSVEPSTHHQSLRHAIAWSYDLLDEPAQRLFRRLSVFRGGWSYQGAVAVSLDGVGPKPDDDVLDALSLLHGASLIRSESGQAETRFAMLESLREFAAEKLDEAGEIDTVRELHAAHLLELATHLGPKLTGPDQGPALDRLDAELDNLRAALAYLFASRPSDALRLCAAIWRYWQMRGHLAEGSRLVAGALSAAGAEAPARDRAAARSAAGGLAYWQGNLPEAETRYEEAVALRRDMNDDVGLADALFDLAFVFDPSLRPPPEDRERTAAGIRIVEEAHRRYVEAGHAPGIAKAEWLLGSIVAERDLDRALGLLSSSVERFREQHDPFGLGWALHSYGLVMLRSRAAESAATAFREALRLFAAAGDSSATGLLLDDFVELAKADGQTLRAARLKGAAAGLRRATQAELAITNAPWLVGDSSDRGLIDPVELERAWREGQALSQAEAIALALGSDAEPVGAKGLRVSALGTLVVERSGEPVTDWGGLKAGHRHALAIFAFLLDRGEHGVTKDEFIEVLWPDANVGQGDLNFHRTLGGLRATLSKIAIPRPGPATVEFSGDRYRLGPSVVGWHDVAEFERQLLSAAEATDELAAIRGLEAARTLYRGDLLDDCPLYGDSEYVEEHRRALRGRLIDALVDLGRRYESRNDLSLASARYREALMLSGGDCPSADHGLERLGIGRT